MLSVPITTKIVNWNSAHGEVYSIQHYVILESDIKHHNPNPYKVLIGKFRAATFKLVQVEIK